jgi:hypothetical protein
LRSPIFSYRGKKDIRTSGKSIGLFGADNGAPAALLG